MSRCRSCPAELVWAITDAGKSIPLDRDPTPAGNVRTRYDGTALRAEVLGPLEVELLDGSERAALRMPHHATCDDAERWRR